MRDEILEFAIKVLGWSNVQIQRLSLDEVQEESRYDKGLRADLPGVEPDSFRLSTVLRSVLPQTMYHVTDFFGCLYTAVLLEEGQILLIGPSLAVYGHDIVTKEQNGGCEVSEHVQTYLKYYYNRLPKVTAINSYYPIILELGKHLFGREPAIQYVYLNQKIPFQIGDRFSQLSMRSVKSEEQMKMMEERAELENRLVEAIHHGDQVTALQVLQLFNGITVPFRKHMKELDAAKYQLVSLNAMFRRETRKVSVHPIYADEVGDDILPKIKSMQAVSDAEWIAVQMIERYCAVVQKYSLAQYSLIIQKIIQYTSTHLKADLSLSSLAQEFSVNRSYLSALFKKETGVTLTNYVNNLRIECAVQLFSRGDRNISEVAGNVGISDVAYFTRLFKKIKGKSPSQYIKD